LKGNIITITSCGKGIGDIFGPGERTPKDWEREDLRLAKGIPASVPEACLHSHANLLCLIEDEREKSEGKGDHEPDPSSGKKRKRIEKPDHGILEFSGACHGGEKDCITEDKTQTPAGESPQPQPLFAHGKPKSPGRPGTRGKKGLKKKEEKKEDDPGPGVPYEPPHRQS